MTFTRKKAVILYGYVIGSHTLERVDVIKDLGIFFDSKLCFDVHINYMFRKCNKLLGFISRACKAFKLKKSSVFLYHSLVRSVLEYGSVIWNTFCKVYVSKIGRIQRKFTRHLYYKMNYRKASYENRLEFLNMRTLASRRLLIDETHLFKIVTGEMCIELSNEFNYFIDRHTTRSDYVFAVRSRNTNILFRSPAFRLPRNHDVYFNEIDILVPSGLCAFKRLISSVPFPSESRFLVY